MKKKLRLLCIALLAMAVLNGCGADSTGESSEDTSSKEQQVQETEQTASGPVEGGSIVVGIQQDIDSLDPHKATAAGTKEILFNIFEGLVKPDVDGNLICAVADSYDISEDGLVYTFTLRDGVKFHNGSDVTCEDVKYSLERAAGLLDGTPLIATLQTIQSVDILDEKTVQVTVGAPNAELIYSFVAAIIPAGSGKTRQRIQWEQDRFLLFPIRRRKALYSQRMKITGRRDCRIWIRWNLRSWEALILHC